MASWEDLLGKAQQGDREAYTEFLRAAVPFLRRRARRLVPTEHLDDFVQDTLLTLHKVLHTYQPGRPVEPWVSGIIKHKYRETWRRLVKHRHTPLDEASALIGDLSVDTVEWKLDSERLLRRLPKEQAKVIYATKIEGRTLAETALLMSRSIAWVKVNVHRATKSLRYELQHDQQRATSKQ
nr:sigma-70 family RNA polymerase sigma factor [Halomonas socia]